MVIKTTEENGVKNEEKSEEKSEKVSVTIRGIDKNLYESISKKAKELNTTVGSIFNEAMREFLGVLDEGLDTFQKITDKTVTTLRATIPTASSNIVLRDIGEIKLSYSDLQKADKPIIIINVRKVIFADDVTDEIFREKIKAIKIADEVYIPKAVSMISAAQRCQLVKRIVQA